MNKNVYVLLFGLLLLSFQFPVIAGTYSVQNGYSNKGEDISDYDFSQNSYNISDEQLQKNVDASDALEQDLKTSFWSKIVNSSHFSSKTATKTYIPINKAQ